MLHVFDLLEERRVKCIQLVLQVRILGLQLGKLLTHRGEERV